MRGPLCRGETLKAGADELRAARRRFQFKEARRLYKAANRVIFIAIVSVPTIVTFSILRNSNVIQMLWLPGLIAAVAMFIRRMGTDALRQARSLRQSGLTEHDEPRA